jgi:CheY-like chemotaxis protein
MDSVDGIDLIRQLRQSNDNIKRLIPIIMLTARAEKSDVEIARDSGVTEFVVKPYDSKTLFQRVRQVIDSPRGFLITPNYVGPDRRRRKKEEDTNMFPQRRTITPVILSDVDIALDGTVPRLIPPDYVLKKRIGITDSIDTIITAEVLEETQKIIDSLKDKSLNWIHLELKESEQYYKQLMTCYNAEVMDKLKQSLLNIKAHTGTFGYHKASEVAQNLYRFLRFNYSEKLPKHNHVLLKHLQALKVLLSYQSQGKFLKNEQQLLMELQRMVAKLSSNNSSLL